MSDDADKKEIEKLKAELEAARVVGKNLYQAATENLSRNAAQDAADNQAEGMIGGKGCCHSQGESKRAWFCIKCVAAALREKDAEIAKLKAELEQARKQLWQAQVTIERLHAELAKAAERQRDMRVIGCMMANLCFNGKQDEEVPLSYREDMRKLQKEWDAILAQAEGKK